MARRFARPIVAAFFLLLLPSPGGACSCMAGIPICETFWKTPVVFAGEVIDITSVKAGAQPQPFADRRVRFKVERVWRGDVADTTDIMTGGGGGDCGYAFRRGERYLVFTYDRGGTLWTGICSPTKRLAAAKAELEYLNQPFPPAAGGRIFGSVSRASGTASRPAPNYTVTLRNDTRAWKATTDAGGRYEFTGIPAGKYQILLDVRPGENIYGSRTVDLPDARGCAAADLTIEQRPPSRPRKLTGQIVWPDGRPAAGASVNLDVTNGGRIGTTVRTDAEGRFEFVVHEGATYRLAAFVDAPGRDRVQWSVESADLVIQGDIEPIRLVLEPPRR